MGELKETKLFFLFPHLKKDCFLDKKK